MGRGGLERKRDDRAGLRNALLVSAALHVAALSVAPAWRGAPRYSAPAPLFARIAPLAAPEPRPNSIAAAPAESPREPRRVAQALAVPRDAGERPDAAAAIPEPEFAQGATRSSSQAAADGGSLAQYRILVMARAKGARAYPETAMRNQWAGRTDVRLVIAPDGAIDSLVVRSSSGHAPLDLEAVELIRQAALQVPLPAALRGHSFDVEIPVIFALDREAR